MESASTATPLQGGPIGLPDLTDTLQQDSKRIIGSGYFGTVYHCLYAGNREVAVKAISIPISESFDQADRREFLRELRRELGLWKRMYHPNIVPFLGIARGEDFGSDYLCMVSMWMPCGTLGDYVNQRENLLPLPGRIRLITGSAAGLQYLHSMSVFHGNIHPGNILIDEDHNPRLIDFGFFHTFSQPREMDLIHLWTNTIRPRAMMWVAPELRYPTLLPDLMVDERDETKLAGDIYSLGSIILFILSQKPPWSIHVAEFANKVEGLQNPPRPSWPIIPDIVWDFIKRCWSPRVPRNRPSAQEVLSFSRDRLQQLLQPDPTSDINVVVFGAPGCGKSSIINLLAEGPIAPVSTDMGSCTKRPRCYPISIGERQFQLWDTTGFYLPRGGDTSPLSPYKQAHSVLRDLPDGVHLILLCAHKDEISSSLGSLYWLINDFFFGGCAPVAFVVTHFDTPDEEWWNYTQRFIITRTGIPIQSIPLASTTTVQTGCDQSRQTLRALLANCARTVTPIPLCLKFSSHEAASLDIATRCGLRKHDAMALVEEFSKPQRPINVVFCGETGAGKSSVINLIARCTVAQVTSSLQSRTLDSPSYVINTRSEKRILIWDTVGFNGVQIDHDMTSKAVVNSVRLVRDLSAESGVDLLVFVKKCGKLTPSELNCYRLFEEFLCEGQVPVAVVVTHLEDQEPLEQWWEMNGEDLLKALGGNVIAHACITSLATTDPEDSKFSAKQSKSRLAVQAMLEDCVSFAKWERISDQLPTKWGGKAGHVAEKMTVENLMNICGLTGELAKEAVKLYNGSG